MDKKQVWEDFKAIIYYFATEPPKQIYYEIRDIWHAITNKRVWVYAWGIMFIVFAFIGNRSLMMFSLVMFIGFFIVQHIQERRWKGIARERWYKKQGITKFKKPKQE